MSEKFTHALFISLLFEVHIRHETLRLSIAIGSFEQHAQVLQRANVTLTNVNDKAWVGLLLKCDLSTFLLRPDLNARLRNINSLLV